jgi:hypothetical protein
MLRSRSVCSMSLLPGSVSDALAGERQPRRGGHPVRQGREVIENKHSTDVESPPPPPPPCLCMSMHTQGKSCSDPGRVLLLNDPPAHSPRKQVMVSSYSSPLASCNFTISHAPISAEGLFSMTLLEGDVAGHGADGRPGPGQSHRQGG